MTMDCRCGVLGGRRRKRKRKRGGEVGAGHLPKCDSFWLSECGAQHLCSVQKCVCARDRQRHSQTVQKHQLATLALPLAHYSTHLVCVGRNCRRLCRTSNPARVTTPPRPTRNRTQRHPGPLGMQSNNIDSPPPPPLPIHVIQATS